jgi:dienelactone hydrolase
MNAYNPFLRGSQPVGTRSYEWTDAGRHRTLPVDVWYPATEQHAGEDLTDATRDHYEVMPGLPEVTQDAVRDANAAEGPFPLIVFSHGFGGEKRQSTFFCTHLASHGFVVAAMDHVGNTTADMLASAGEPEDPNAMGTFIHDRPLDASFVIDRMQSGDAGVSVDAGRIGMSGHSFGGWTTLMTVAGDDRIRAALPLAPAGGVSQDDQGNPVRTPLSDAMQLDWPRVVPTLYLVADLDSILPLSSMQDLHNQTESARSIVLRNADHFHFADRVEESHDGFKMMAEMMAAAAEGIDSDSMNQMSAAVELMKPSSELCPGEDAYAFVCGLGLAHFDTHLRQIPGAKKMINGDLVALLAERDINVAELVAIKTS